MEIDPRSEDWRGLGALLVIYLNQDFPEDYGTPEDAVKAYCRHSAPEELAKAADAIRRTLDGTEDDADTLRALEPFGRDYHPESGGWSIREWLGELERVLRDPDRPTRLNEQRAQRGTRRST